MGGLMRKQDTPYRHYWSLYILLVRERTVAAPNVRFEFRSGVTRQHHCAESRTRRLLRIVPHLVLARLRRWGVERGSVEANSNSASARRLDRYAFVLHGVPVGMAVTQLAAAQSASRFEVCLTHPDGTPAPAEGQHQHDEWARPAGHAIPAIDTDLSAATGSLRSIKGKQLRR